MGNFRPFIAQNNDEIVRQFQTAEYNNMLGRMAHLYDSDAATELTVVTSGGNISPNMTDTRYRSGAYSQSTGDNDAVDDGAAEYPQEPTTAEPELITGFSYDRVNQTLFSGVVPVQANETWYKAQAIKPVKFENGGFVEMSYQDVLDTYIEDWYDYQEGASPSDPAAAGSYFITTNSSETGATAVSATPVFVDTVADAGSYQASLIGGTTTTTTTTNFSAVSGTGSQTVLTSIGGTGVSVTVNSVSLSGAGVFHFGDARYSTTNTANTRPNGATNWFRAGINANGHRTYVFSDDVAYEVYYNAADATRRATFNSAYLSYGHNKWDVDYPTADDTNLIDYTPDPFLYATGSPNHSTGTDVVKITPDGATHLYIWISGDDGASNDQNAFVRLEGTNGNSRYFSFNRNSSNSTLQTRINELVSDNIISSGTYAKPSNGAALRLVLGGKLKHINGDFRAGSQPYSGGFAFVEGTTVTAQNNTGFYIQTPIGTTRAPLSTWSLGSSNSWTIAAGSYTQTSGTTTYQDHFNTTNYYLHKVDSQKQTQGTGYRTPLIVDYNGSGTAVGLRAMTYAEFDTFFGSLINYTTKNAAGYRLRYNFDGTYGTIVSSIYNQQMTSVSGAYTTRFVNINDYRAQEFPNGTIVNQDTYNLKLERY